MKSFLTKWKISAALDSGRPLPAALLREIANDPELQHFVESCQALPRPAIAGRVDEELHDSIMARIRENKVSPSRPRRSPSRISFAAAAGLAMLAVCFWLGRPRPAIIPAHPAFPVEQSLSVVEVGEQMPAQVPHILAGPLTEEWKHMDHDLQNTKQILLSSFP